MARRRTHDGTLAGLPFLATGPPDAPPLAILPGLSPQDGIGGGPVAHAELGLARTFADRFRVVWLAPRAAAPANGGRPTMAAYAAAHAAALCEAFDAPVDVLGMSSGGSIALQLAADHPDVVRRLVLVSAAARLGAIGRADQRALAERLRAGDHRGALARFLGDMVPRPPQGTRGPGAAVYAGVAALARPPLLATGWALGPLLWPRAGAMRELAALVEAEDAYDVRERLGDVRAPTLVLAGGRDPYYDAGAFEQVAHGVQDGRLVRFARRGHVTVALDPRFAPAVAAFLAER
jgi:pimeloyl-ACP methyl ester carboxylesterase